MTNYIKKGHLRAFDYGSDVTVMTLDGEFKRYEPATYYPEVKDRHAIGHKLGKKVRHG